MQNTNKTENYIIIFLVFLSVLSYFVGFIFKENSAGGAHADFVFVWLNLSIFEENTLLDALKLTATTDGEIFHSTRTPGFYILNKIFNPFTGNINSFQTSISLFSVLIPISFFWCLKLKFEKSNIFYLLLISSLIFLSPYFRTSAFWGMEENFGILSVLLSGIFLIKYLKTNNSFYEKILLFLLTFFSSSCVYLDQKLVLVPLLCFLTIIFSKRNFSHKLLAILFYFLFSIPFLMLVYMWGNIAPTGDATGRGLLTNYNFHHLGYVLTIISFYLFPMIFLIKNVKQELRSLNNRENYFLALLFFIFLLYFLFFHDLENEYHLGGGAISKFIELIFDNTYLQKMALSIAFFSSFIIIILFKNQNYVNKLILAYLVATSIVITPALFQEYYDPLMIILFFLFFKNKLILNFRNSLLFYFYFSIFLISANFYY